MRFQLYIENESVDLYGDEGMQLTRKAKDLNDLGSVYSDFSTSFKIPCSPRNNKMFTHWYNVDVVSGFNAHTKKNAHIEIDGLKVFDGIIELTDVTFVKGEPQDYSIVFYGEGKKLSTAIGDDTLQDIDWEDYRHHRSSGNVTNSWSGNLLSGKVLYPVIAWEEPYSYSDDSGVVNNIKNSTGVALADLKPAIKLTEMVKACFENYGYTSAGGFYTDTYLTDLYVAPSAYAGKIDAVSLTPTFDVRNNPTVTIGASGSYFQRTFNTEVSDNSNSMNPTSGVLDAPTAGDYDFTIQWYTHAIASGAQIDIAIFVDGVKTFEQTGFQNTGLKSHTFSSSTLAAGDQVTLRFKTSDSGAQIKELKWTMTDGPATSSSKNMDFGEIMPRMKVNQFLNGVIKTFNLVLVPKSDTQIDLEFTQDWLASGTTRNWTKYLDIEAVTHEKVKVPVNIEFKHQDSADFVNTAFSRNLQRAFGSVQTQPSVDFAEGDLRIESPFTIVPPAFLQKVTNAGAVVSNTTIQMVSMIDDALSPIQADLLLFYYNGLKSTDSWYFAGSQKTTFPTISPFSAYPTTSTSKSVAYSLESSLSGDAPEDTLLNQAWLSHISRLYSSTSRIVICNMYLPVGEWLNMELNDTIELRGRYYKIDSLTYDMLTQQAQVRLMTYPDVDTWSAASTNNNYDITEPSSTDAGLTFIGLGSQSNVLGNIIKVNDTSSTDAPNTPNNDFQIRNWTVVTNMTDIRSSAEEYGNDNPT